ncbi:MAG: iron-containing redox enzyme family protein [Chloroflexi bacterium]|nr:iron-containing redox enzyme family protein [Chloroflexota bacterium]
MPKSPQAFQSELRDMLEELRPHGLSYYHPLINGDVETREQLEAWCRSFYIRDVAVLLARAFAKCPHLDARRFIAENLYEEEGKFRPGMSHPELSMRLPKYFGMTEEQIEAGYRGRTQSPAAQARARAHEQMSWIDEFAGFGLGAEYYAPAVFGMIADKLLGQFGLPKDVLEFFYVHLYEDEDHARRTMEIVAKYADSDEKQHQVVETIKRNVLSNYAGYMGSSKAKRLPEPVVAELRRRASVSER